MTLPRPPEDERSNGLLRALPDDDFLRLKPLLEPIALDEGQILQPAHEDVSHIIFPGHGIVSVIATTARKRRLEVGIYGRDGMSGAAVVLGAGRAPHQHVTQVPGAGWRAPAQAVADLANESPALRLVLLRFVHTFMLQVAGTALSNGACTVEQRLARWLLMCSDRLEGDELSLTHEFLALMLAVRRPSVTVALHMLEGEGVIQSTRGRIVILDRERMQGMAGDTYGGAEAEYLRLIGEPI